MQDFIRDSDLAAPCSGPLRKRAHTVSKARHTDAKEKKGTANQRAQVRYTSAGMSRLNCQNNIAGQLHCIRAIFVCYML